LRPLRRQLRDEQGFTMVEMAVIMLVFGILLAITIPIVSTVLQTSSKVNVTYSNVDEQLWLSTTLQRLVRAAVAPTPSVTGSAPVPAFVTGSVTPTSMTFFTNAGTSRGPEMVVAKCTTTPHTSTLCTKSTATFSVAIYRAEVTPSTGKSFCPTVTGTASTHCLYTKTTANGKTLTITKRTLVSISNVRNGTNGQVLFLYTYAIPSGTTTKRPTVQHPKATQDSVFSTCTAGTPLAPFKSCPAGEIESVTYDLQINAKTTARYGGSQAEDDTGIFVLSSTSMGYEPSVG
jgi:Tfp pilus assembly protein FimT